MIHDIEHVKFIKYTGKYPCLCMGILVLAIDGKLEVFGDYQDSVSHDTFWRSGGSYGFHNNYLEEYIEKDRWIIHRDELPEEYKKYADEIEEVFNNNVPYGCCGGCL